MSSKNVTVRELAQAAKVSIGTVSRALKGQPGLSAQTRAEVLRVAQAMGYDLGKLRNSRPRRILFLYSRHIGGADWLATNQFYSVVLHGTESACREAGVSLSLMSLAAGDDVATQVRRHEPDALIGVGYFDPETLAAVRACELPLVLADHYQAGLHCINDDNLNGALLATRHLIEGGAQRPALIVGPMSHHSVALRAKGFRRALFEAGRLADPDLEVALDMALPYDQAGRAAMQRLLALPQPPDAVFAYNDETALNAMQACTDAGLRVPEDLRFVGYDDIAAAARAPVPLSTIRVDKEALGREAVAALLDGTPAAGDTLLPVELVLRESSRIVARAGGAAQAGPRGAAKARRLQRR